MSFDERIEHVHRVATDYSDEERARFREVFAPRAARYRRHSRLSLLIGCCAFVGWMAAIRFLPGFGLEWVGGILFLGMLALLLFGSFSQPSLECPACYSDVDSRQLGRFCPECGSEQFRTRSWLLAPNCDSCGAVPRRGKSRGYSIRACTHCGVLLDDRGV
jgi:hypothetical protein